VGDNSAFAANESLNCGTDVPEDQKASEVEKHASVKLEELQVLAGKRWYLTVSAAIAIVGSLISGTYFVVDYVRIRPLEKDREDARNALSNVQADVVNLKNLLERSEQKASALALASERPVAIFPFDRSSVIGSGVRLSWDYGKHTQTTKYILEIQPLSGARPAVLLNVDRPETKSMFYTFDTVGSTEFLWRVRQGEIVSGQQVGEGPWSSASAFAIYPSVVDRIKRTGKLLVATTPTSYDPFVGVNTKGQYVGFELNLLRWLLPKIGEQLHMTQAPILDITEVPWNQIFQYMQDGAADIAVRSITRSQIREKEYPNLRFTIGYVRNHQILIQANSDGQFPASLSGRIVGVKSRSVNELAAKYLATKYGFSVNSSFTAYGDLYDALRRGDISFALVDSSLVHEHLNKTVFALGGDLDGDLKDFYQKQLGFDDEEYSVLVHEGASKELREAMNRILKSPEYRNFVKSSGVEEPGL
jgi:ABC-type amino acid transport substrate-binding protein